MCLECSSLVALCQNYWMVHVSAWPVLDVFVSDRLQPECQHRQQSSSITPSCRTLQSFPSPSVAGVSGPPWLVAAATEQSVPPRGMLGSLAVAGDGRTTSAVTGELHRSHAVRSSVFSSVLSLNLCMMSATKLCCGKKLQLKQDKKDPVNDVAVLR